MSTTLGSSLSELSQPHFSFPTEIMQLKENLLDEVLWSALLKKLKEIIIMVPSGLENVLIKIRLRASSIFQRRFKKSYFISTLLREFVFLLLFS